jgi:hypothetical protein
MSNNKFPKCPALMSDGKIFTDYNTHKVIDLNFAAKNNVKGAQYYRLFLQDNAKKIMRKNLENNDVCSAWPPKVYDPMNAPNYKGYDPYVTNNYQKF